MAKWIRVRILIKETEPMESNEDVKSYFLGVKNALLSRDWVKDVKLESWNYKIKVMEDK